MDINNLIEDVFTIEIPDRNYKAVIYKSSVSFVELQAAQIVIAFIGRERELILELDNSDHAKEMHDLLLNEIWGTGAGKGTK